MIKVIKAGVATVTMITVGDYSSVTPGVLQISTTTKNSRPRIKKVAVGVEFRFRILTSLLVVVSLLEEASPS